MSRTRLPQLLPALVIPALLVSCSGPSDEEGSATPSQSSSSEPTPGLNDSGSTAGDSDDVTGTVVSLRAGDTEVEVTITEDTPAARDFLSMLPLTLDFEEYAGNEKISYLPRELDYEGTETQILNQGDFLYFIPWGNVGFWYTEDQSNSPDVSLVLGTYEATLEELEQLESGDVTVDVEQ
ncbi:cyclophilin-like fold protein [Corynebacterium sp. AOP40-9SA-29]|uniref:cyclophilin-like fold protein n=1 Tax=Corynebacterium sp. AOP40-9SA-29 TaxID=3457677 RepID=UPI004033C17E